MYTQVHLDCTRAGLPILFKEPSKQGKNTLHYANRRSWVDSGLGGQVQLKRAEIGSFGRVAFTKFSILILEGGAWIVN